MTEEKPNAREEFLRDAHERVRREYEKHVIVEEGEGRWLLKSPREKGGDDPKYRWEWAMWTEVICLHGTGILVDGDIDPVVFRFGPADPIARVHWMGRRKHAWDSYFREKACIGMGGRGFGTCLEEWRPEIAICDVEEEIKQLTDADTVDPRPETVKMIEALRHDVIEPLKNSYGEYSQEEFCRELYGVLDDCEYLDRYGTVPSQRMFTAHAALARLSVLLEPRG